MLPSKEVAHHNAKRIVEVAPATFVEVRACVVEICDVRVWRVVPLGDVLDIALEGVIAVALAEPESGDMDFVARDVGDVYYKLHPFSSCQVELRSLVVGFL